MLAYRIVRRLSALLLSLFYRRIEVVGLERLPRSGPMIVAANHQNALVDGLLVVSTLPRPVTMLAKAPLFHNPVVGPFLKALRAIPVQRRQDPGADLSRNQDMFDAVSAALARRRAILIFPEGISQPEPALMPLRTGAARMLLDAEAAHGGHLGVRLQPVGLVFHEPGTFRTGWALVVVGDPVPTDDCVALHPSDPEEAVRRLTARLTDALARLIVEAGDRQTMRLVQVAEAIWRVESGLARDPKASADWRQRAVRAHRYLAEREPERVAAIRQEVESYGKALELAGLTAAGARGRPPLAAAVRYTLREGTALTLGLPLAFLGIVIHALPYNLVRLAMRLVRPSADAEATYKLGAGVIFFPVGWALEAWAVGRLAGGWGVTGFLLLLAPTAFFALAWADRLARAGREVRRFLRFLVERDLARLLRERRQAIVAELAALERRVPASVLDGDTARVP
jgi:glycerol-3-phosphate O-acyltransferase / dihydroxyacetone phosphate acyltransferase